MAFSLRALFGNGIRPGQIYLSNNTLDNENRQYRVEVKGVKRGKVNFKLMGSAIYTDENMIVKQFRRCYTLHLEP